MILLFSVEREIMEGMDLHSPECFHEESKVAVYILEFGHKGTDDFQANLASLHKTEAEIKFIQSEEQLPVF